MTEKEKKYFDLLTEDRQGSADTLEKPSMRGIQRSVVEKYSDQAHFIYELLQNADDAHATEVSFKLYEDKLVFIHNGTRHFFVSDPKTEEEDTLNGTLGDINAITSVANSNKSCASIGKFGVGFKAVFQYTQTPYIYDPGVAFKISRFIVPLLIYDDFPGRKSEDTVFVFPFDHPERSARESYADIADKLKDLVFPNLFLNHLGNIIFEIGNQIGLYGKEVIEEKLFDDIIARKIKLFHNVGEDIIEDILWIFNRKDENNHDYSVGYFLNSEGALKPVNMYAFCFFQTKEVTNLNYIIHAPFLLTDSREGIKAGEQHNKDLIDRLAELSADSLACLRVIGEISGKRLIDDSIIRIIPIDSNVFTDIKDKNKISFIPFYNAQKRALQDGLLPARNGYTSREKAYWADYGEIYDLFSDNELEELLGKKDEGIKFVFTSYSRHRISDVERVLQNYIDRITIQCINENTVFLHIDASFIANRTDSWLKKFYEWLNNVPKRFYNGLKTKPIFLDNNRQPVAAFNKMGQPSLFLPSSSKIECPIVCSDFLGDEKTKEFLIRTVGLREPELKDYIYNNVIPNYLKDQTSDAFEHFEIFFRYYLSCSQNDKEQFINQLNNLTFLEYYDIKNKAYKKCISTELYYPDDDLIAYFETTPDVKFLAIDKYIKWADNNNINKNVLSEFFKELRINYLPKVYRKNIEYHDGLPKPCTPHVVSYYEWTIDGYYDVLREIATNKSSEKSILLWKYLAKCFELNPDYELDKDECQYYYRKLHNEVYESRLHKDLTSFSWIAKKDGSFGAPCSIYVDDIADDYMINENAFSLIISFLGIGERVKEENDYLTEEQRGQIELAKKAQSLGISSMEELQYAADLLKKQRIREANKNNSMSLKSDVKKIEEIAEDISNKVFSINNENEEVQTEQVQETDSDEYNPKAIDYSIKIEKEKEKQAKELSKIARMETLQEDVLSSKKYSYGWFKSLLEMEIINSKEDALNSREINISFAKIEREEGTDRTYILSQPSQYIPHYMEDIEDIPLNMHFKDGSQKNTPIEVSSVQSYTLRVKLKQNVSLNDVDLSQISTVTIKAVRPIFLTQAYEEKMLSLRDKQGTPLSDDFNFKENLPSNIRFVFGPPGTGKTTYLVNEILLPIIKEQKENKVLVLTPTNKAADVIAKRIIELMGDDTSYENWLTRFGITGDEIIEKSAVFRDKTFDIRSLKRSVTISTIARFAYDYFMPKNERLYIDSINWDYIIIDEASMIPLYQIIYPIIRKTPKEFIIAGDPFQIEPISTVELWNDENIFTMVNLHSFDKPTTEPNKYPIIQLTTQYRSIPEIGEVFSKFTYGGILKHQRLSRSRKNLNIADVIDIDSLNLIKFPVSRYESVYRPKRLNNSSSYQIYAAIFTMEFVNFLAKAIVDRNKETKVTIGVIAPYKAQASLIDRLISSINLPKTISVNVGTIHGFQGDECDIVMVVLNPPTEISSSPKLFINKQNILNVAISRAKDYLFLILPDNETDGVNELKKVKQIEHLMKQTNHCKEFSSGNVENIMFGNEKFIENNSFATSHHVVNVYGKPEMRYEIRSEDSAVDIQIHR